MWARFLGSAVLLVAVYGCTAAVGGGDTGDAASADDAGSDAVAREGAGRDGAESDAAPSGDGSVEGSSADADAAAVDGTSGGDAGDGCSAVVTACPVSTDAGDENGLLTCGTCAPCIDPNDDSACTSAYGGAPDAGSDGGPAQYICNAGSCTPGDCHDDSDCVPSGRICGIKAPFACGACTSDADCKHDSDYQGQGLTVCDIAMGTCGPIDCNVADGQPCAQNPADVCCSQTCTAGDCCSDAQCGGATPHCVKHSCAP